LFVFDILKLLLDAKKLSEKNGLKKAVVQEEVVKLEKRIAVEEGLSDIKEVLQENGYKIIGMDNVREASAVVIAGIDEDVMGMQDLIAKIPIINAEGKTGEEILHDLKQRNI